MGASDRSLVQTIFRRIFPGLIMSQIATLEPFTSLQDAIQHLLLRMQSQTPLKTWVFSEVATEDWNILACVDPVFGLEAGRTLPWSDSVCKRMLVANGPMYTGDLEAMPQLASAPIARELGLISYFGVPLTIPGQMQGMLCGFARHKVSHDMGIHLPLAETVGRTIVTFWQQKLRRDSDRRKLEELRQEAITDPLTGLLNRRGLRHHVRRFRTDDNEPMPCGMIVADLDGLKMVNDRFGHDAGDALISGAAVAIREALRSEDVIARVGGDEFAIFLPVNSAKELERMVDRIEAALARHSVAATLGYSWSNGSIPPDYVYRRADHHLISRKRRKKSVQSAPSSDVVDPNLDVRTASGAS